MELIKPKKLVEGDTIGLVAPSTSSFVIKQSILKTIEDTFLGNGFHVEWAEHVTLEPMGDKNFAKKKASDILEMFLNPKISAIQCLIGGYTSLCILEHLNFDIIRKNPKIFVGYSDITLLCEAIVSKSRLITFLGPLSISFGCQDVSSYTIRHFFHALKTNQLNHSYEPSTKYAEEPWYLEPKNKRKWIKSEGYISINSGSAEGITKGGNLDSILALNGTSFAPVWDNCILFIECSLDEDPRLFLRHLTQLKMMGVFEKIKGLVVGRASKKFKNELSLFEIVQYVLVDYSLPVILNVNFGHVDPIFTLPLHVRCKIDADKKTIQILEHFVE